MENRLENVKNGHEALSRQEALVSGAESVVLAAKCRAMDISESSSEGYWVGRT